jgi:predicted transcriptional regulator
MRTTIDLPDDLHARARAIARDTGRTLSETVADLILRGLEDRDAPVAVARSPRSGLPVLSLGSVITSEDVRALEDDA